MKKSELKQLIKEEIQKVLGEATSLADATEDDPLHIKPVGETGVKLNMRKILRILKNAGYSHSISRGNRFFPTEILAGGKNIDNIDWGAVRINPSGELFGSDNWGMDIEKEEDILQALDQFEIDQENYYKKHYPDQYKERTGKEI